MQFAKRLIRFLISKFKWSRKVKFDFSTEISSKSTFEGMNKIHHHSRFYGHLGFGSYIGPFCSLNAKIGKFTSIAPYVRSNNGIHPYTYPYVSTAPCFFSLNKNKAQNGSTFAKAQCFDEYSYSDSKNKYGITIGNDCWIGEGVFITGGVTVGDGAVILAHAVVTKDIPPYAIVGGIPSKVIKYRYTKEDIDFLLKIRWWDNSEKWFKEHWRMINNFSELKNYYEKTYKSLGYCIG